MQTEDGKVTYQTGAVRSDDAKGTRFDLVCPIGLTRLAARYDLGDKAYGAYNWTKGMPVDDILNHLERHLQLWKGGDRSEDHMAAIAWGVFAIMHFESTCCCGDNLQRFTAILNRYTESRIDMDNTTTQTTPGVMPTVKNADGSTINSGGRTGTVAPVDGKGKPILTPDSAPAAPVVPPADHVH